MLKDTNWLHESLIGSLMLWVLYREEWELTWHRWCQTSSSSTARHPSPLNWTYAISPRTSALSRYPLSFSHCPSVTVCHSVLLPLSLPMSQFWRKWSMIYCSYHYWQVYPGSTHDLRCCLMMNCELN